jgi:tetraacyldisaccharide 4'-kinase
VSKSTASRVLLLPISILWLAAARVRAFAYRSGLLREKKLPGTVISVGNLTTGGTGKTPIVIWIAQKLHAEGKRVAVLTRGYRSRADLPPGSPQSDEVAIYRERFAHHIDLGVGADRYERGIELARHGVEWFVLDDGFQHLQLARDVNVVLVDSTDPFGHAGISWLRESKSALTRADLVVITRTTRAPALEEIVRRLTRAPIFYATMECTQILPLPNPSSPESVSIAIANMQSKRAFAFCGIGNPQAFFDDLKRWGVSVVGSMRFADHHFYSVDDVAKIEVKAKATGAEILLCTEKDVFNLQRVTFIAFDGYYVRAEMRFTDPDRFWRAMHSRLHGNAAN